MTVRSLVLIACAVAATSLQVQAQPTAPVPPTPPAPPAGAPAPPPAQLLSVLPELPTVALQPLLDRVGREAKKEFLVDGRVRPEIFLGGVQPDDVTYPLLLSILRANGLAAATLDGRVNIVPVNEMRFMATPIEPNDGDRIAADEWITRVLTTTNVETAGIVPVLRPLLPVSAHLSAMPPHQLIVVDRYANVQRITAIVRSIDQAAAGQSRN